MKERSFTSYCMTWSLCEGSRMNSDKGKKQNAMTCIVSRKVLQNREQSGYFWRDKIKENRRAAAFLWLIRYHRDDWSNKLAVRTTKVWDRSCGRAALTIYQRLVASNELTRLWVSWGDYRYRPMSDKVSRRRTRSRVAITMTRSHRLFIDVISLLTNLDWTRILIGLWQDEHFPSTWTLAHMSPLRHACCIKAAFEQ